MSDIIGKFQLTDMNDIVRLAKPVLKDGRSVKFIVVGNSMNPVFINNRDKVTVSMAEKIKKRDVILYRRNDGSYVLHRVVGKGKLGFKLCGDNQTVIEYPVKREDVVAVVTSFERKGKEYSTACLWYRLYSFLWCLVIPLRRFEFKIAYGLKKLFKRSK